jgi:hypothetical protein
MSYFFPFTSSVVITISLDEAAQAAQAVDLRPEAQRSCAEGAS